MRQNSCTFNTHNCTKIRLGFWVWGCDIPEEGYYSIGAATKPKSQARRWLETVVGYIDK